MTTLHVSSEQLSLLLETFGQDETTKVLCSVFSVVKDTFKTVVPATPKEGTGFVTVSGEAYDRVVKVVLFGKSGRVDLDLEPGFTKEMMLEKLPNAVQVCAID